MACIYSISLHWFDSNRCCRPLHLLHLTNLTWQWKLSCLWEWTYTARNPVGLIFFAKKFTLCKKKKKGRKLGRNREHEQSVGLRVASSAWAWLSAARAACWQQTCVVGCWGAVAARQGTVETSNHREQQVQRTNYCFGWFRRRQKEKKNFQRSQWTWKKVSGFSARGTAMPSDFISFSSVDLDLNFPRSLRSEGEFSSGWP